MLHVERKSDGRLIALLALRFCYMIQWVKHPFSTIILDFISYHSPKRRRKRNI